MAKASIASQANIVPACAPSGAIQVAASSFDTTPYVAFTHPNAKAYPRLISHFRDLAEGDPVLINPEPFAPVRLQPFEFLTLMAKQYWAEFDDNGEIVKVSFTEESKPFNECIDSLLLVFTPKGLTPARCSWRTTKCRAIHRATEALKIADSEDWFSQSAEHKATLAAPHPWCRVKATVKLTTQTSRGSGRKYIAASANVSPTGLADWNKITELFKGDGTTLDKVRIAYERRIVELTELAK